MYLEKIEIKNFRNIEQISLEPNNKINVIYGENGQGKTNILEAIWLFTGCKSFRTLKDKEMIRFGEPMSQIDIEYSDDLRTNRAQIQIEKKRNAALNGVELESPRELIGKFYSIVFSPSHLSLIKDGPVNRRKFIDTAISQTDSIYAKKLAYYNHLIDQKNALLKLAAEDSGLLSTFDIWDEKIAQSAAEIISYRIEYIKKLEIAATNIYSGISDNREEMRIKYASNIRYESEDTKDIESKCLESLKKNRANDLYLKSTGNGPHRDDIEIFIDGISARKFGSQGQQRSASLALKLGEADIIREEKGEDPVILLDDVMSELDLGRQNYILHKMLDKQVFVTCCEKETVERLEKGKIYRIENGKVID
ncbi:MAG: DNA replication/repair protein RecF [Clostridiales bacterium]|nr:DNA replication/repair protein RecF [Clostridiales bacterium]